MPRKPGRPLSRQPASPAPAPRGRWRLRHALLFLPIVAALVALAFWWTTHSRLQRLSEVAIADATFVGSAACATCHRVEADAWRTSQHAVAMQVANDATVRADFAGATFRAGDVESRFAKRDGRFFARTGGADGAPADFAIAYTFGVDPLQQYLVAFPDGRLQALTIAWDTRSKAKGGARWFTLYPGTAIGPHDPLHWTGREQNANFMCAECHVTALQKNYDASANRFDTRWSELGVGCEACHGPGSAHVRWADARGRGTNAGVTNKGLLARLDERSGIAWKREAAHDTATRSAPRTGEREIDVCAQCHARRAPIAPGYTAGKPFLDYYRPALLMPGLYHADGQQRAEVYDWGSFLQSRMYAAGVTCSDCHEPHGAKLRVQGNALCTRCHSAERFDTRAHHHHAADSVGAQCVSCHMPTATYMQVDARHDHGLRVPRPDLSAALGVPNACTACHADRDAHWAAAQVKTWSGTYADSLHRYAPAFAAADAGEPGASAQLRKVAGEAGQPAIARASAIARLDPNESAANLDAIAGAAHDANALVRLGALDALARAPSDMQLRYGAHLLSDPYRALRIDAAGMLAGAVGDATAPQREAFAAAAAEYAESQRFNADRPEARTSLGAFDVRRGNAVQGIAELQSSIALDPLFAPAYVELADAYREMGQEARAEGILRDGLARLPRAAALHHALGLTLVRMKRSDAALAELAEAAKLDTTNARFAYVYGVALNSFGRSAAAIAALTAASRTHPANRDILEALASMHRDAGDRAEAARYDDRVRALATE